MRCRRLLWRWLVLIGFVVVGVGSLPLSSVERGAGGWLRLLEATNQQARKREYLVFFVEVSSKPTHGKDPHQLTVDCPCHPPSGVNGDKSFITVVGLLPHPTSSPSSLSAAHGSTNPCLLGPGTAPSPPFEWNAGSAACAVCLNHGAAGCVDWRRSRAFARRCGARRFWLFWLVVLRTESGRGGGGV